MTGAPLPGATSKVSSPPTRTPLIDGTPIVLAEHQTATSPEIDGYERAEPMSATVQRRPRLRVVGDGLRGDARRALGLEPDGVARPDRGVPGGVHAGAGAQQADGPFAQIGRTRSTLRPARRGAGRPEPRPLSSRRCWPVMASRRRSW